MEYAKTSVLTFEPCALQENTINFELQKPIDEGLYELFKPFGYLNRELGNKRLGEIYVTDKNGKLLLKLQGHIGSRTLWRSPACQTPAKKYKLYKKSINKSLYFAQISLSSSPRRQRVTAQLSLSRK